MFALVARGLIFLPVMLWYSFTVFDLTDKYFYEKYVGHLKDEGNEKSGEATGGLVCELRAETKDLTMGRSTMMSKDVCKFSRKNICSSPPNPLA